MVVEFGIQLSEKEFGMGKTICYTDGEWNWVAGQCASHPEKSDHQLNTNKVPLEKVDYKG